MISSLSDLLQRIQNEESKILGEIDIKHGPTIGDMYEGLSQSLLSKAIPPGLDLRVVSGFVEGQTSDYSNQADILLVQGESRKLPYTHKYIYPIEKVLAVFEIKKTLYGEQLADSMQKMKRIAQINRDFDKEEGYSKKNISYSLHSFAKAYGYFLKISETRKLPPPLPNILQIFITEQLTPVRIVWGYEGYVDEQGLRSGLADYLAKTEGTRFTDWPSLIVCRNNSILKINGMPYCDVIQKQDDKINILASNAENPLRIMLELIWTKICVELEVGLPMDDTLNMETLSPLAQYEYLYNYQESNKNGFGIEITESLPPHKNNAKIYQWEPYESSIEETVFLTIAFTEGLVKCTDENLKSCAIRNGKTAFSIIESLVSKRILAWADTEKTTARPVEESAITTMTPDGRILVSDQAKLMSLWSQRL